MNKTLSKKILSALLAGVIMTSGANIFTDAYNNVKGAVKGAATNVLHNAQRKVGTRQSAQPLMAENEDNAVVQLRDESGKPVYLNSENRITFDKNGDHIVPDEGAVFYAGTSATDPNAERYTVDENGNIDKA